MSNCRACGAPIIWAELEADEAGITTLSRIALDSHEVLGGDWQLDGGRAVRSEPNDRKPAFREHDCSVVVRRGAPD